VSNDVSLHHIPNIQWGQWANRHEIILLFTRLHNPTDPDYKVPIELLHDFYALVTRPAFQRVMGLDRASNLAPSLSQAMFRAQNLSGKITYHARLLPDERIDDFVEEMRNCVTESGLDWAEGFLLVHQVKGVKDNSYHHPAEAQEALVRSLKANYISITHFYDPKNTWVGDVAIQLFVLGKCLALRTDAHVNLFIFLLGIPAHIAVMFARTFSSAYVRDFILGTMALSGWRGIHSSLAGGDFEVLKSQAYSTDKELLATLYEEGHYAKHVRVKDVTQVKHDRTLEGIELSYAEALNSEMVPSVRIEVRVPAAFCTKVLAPDRLNMVDMHDYVVALDLEVYW
jgi:hypothetical protein